MNNSTTLLNLIRDHFNLEEIQRLTYALSIDYEELPAPGKSAKIIELIRYCHRYGILPQLLTQLQSARPTVSWPDPDQPYQLDFLLGNKLPDLLPFEPETVIVPAGAFIMGSDDDPLASPEHVVTLDAYWIGKYPVTNGQYFEFVRQAQYDVPNKQDWFLGQPQQEKVDFPVVGVSWHDALAYCRWLSAQTGKKYRLPTEAEWEKAARGANGRLFPWGDDWQAGLCNRGGAGLTAVTAYDDTPSAYGCVDLIGNIQQWTSTLWGDERKRPTYAYPYRHDAREMIDAADARFRLRRIYRGAIFSDTVQASRLTSRGSARPQQTTLTRGFRVVLNP